MHFFSVQQNTTEVSRQVNVGSRRWFKAARVEFELCAADMFDQENAGVLSERSLFAISFPFLQGYIPAMCTQVPLELLHCIIVTLYLSRAFAKFAFEGLQFKTITAAAFPTSLMSAGIVTFMDSNIFFIFI